MSNYQQLRLSNLLHLHENVLLILFALKLGSMRKLLSPIDFKIRRPQEFHYSILSLPRSAVACDCYINARVLSLFSLIGTFNVSIFTREVS